MKLAAYDPAKAEQNNAAAAVPTIPLLLYIAFAFGFSLAVNVFIFYRVSGGLFNPAVTLAVTVLGKMPPVKAAILVVAQLLGAIFAAGIAEIMLPGDLAVDTTINYATGITTTQALFFEAFLTFELIITILMLAVEKVTPQPFSPSPPDFSFLHPANHVLYSTEQHSWHHSS